MYECPHYSNCVGGKITSNATSAISLCREGAGGPLCSICSTDYFLSEYEGCLMCSIGNAWLGPLLVVIAMLLISAGLMLLKERALALYEKHKHKAEQYSQRLTAMFVTQQILVILNTTHKSVGGKDIPTPYKGFMDFLGFVTLDVVQFVPFDCM